MKQASELRKELSKMDLDPGYFCKFVKDQFVRHTIKKQGLKTILDIGCDTCYMTGLLKYDNYFHKYLGIDVNDNANIDYFDPPHTGFLKMDINGGTLNFISRIEEGTFDCILLLDVIEHFNSPEEGWDVLDTCATKLRKGGFLFVSTPNQLGDKPNWPEYHKYEYKLENFQMFNLRRKDLKCYTYFGWSMADEMFDEIIREQKKMIHSQYHYEDLFPKSMARVFGAIGHPHKSRDIIFVWQKKDNS